MSDPLSIAASVAGLLGLTIQVSGLLYKQVRVVKHAPTDAEDLLHELQAIEGTLQALAAFLDSRGIQDGRFGPNSMLTSALQGCTVHVTDMKKRVEKLSTHGVGGIIERGKSYYKREERSEIVAALHRSLSIFHLSLSLEGMDLCLKSIQDFAVDMKGIQTAVNLLSHNSLEQITQLLVPLVETSDSVSHISKTVEKFDSKQQEQENQELLDWLNPYLNPMATQAEMLSRWQSGTGSWLIEHDIFMDWLHSSGGRLWCPGMPGAGKTILTAVVIDYLQRTLVSPNVGIAFAYCSYKEQAVQSTINILACLTQQLINRNATLPKELVTLYNRHKSAKTRPTLDECRNLLISQITNFSTCFIILDALDEIDERSGDRSKLISELKNISELKSLPRITKLLFTSRHSTSDEEQFNPSLQIEIRAPESDIVSYVEARMLGEHRLARHFKAEPTLAPLVLENVVKQAQGMFLLAELHMDSLVKKQNRSQVKMAFQNLPKTLDSTYEDAMQRLSAQQRDDVELAIKVLSWISYAIRPLSIVELQHAIAIDFSEKEFDEEALTDQDILTSVCGGLVRIDQETTTVRLIHSTAQEYFKRHRDRIFPDAKNIIARTCITYLSFEAFSDKTLSHFLETLKEGNEREIILERYPLLDYTVNHWGIHVRGSFEDIFLNDIHKFLVNKNIIFYLIGSAETFQKLTTLPRDREGTQRAWNKINMFSIVAHFGLLTVMNALLEEPNRTKLKTTKSGTHNSQEEMLTFEERKKPKASNNKPSNHRISDHDPKIASFEQRNNWKPSKHNTTRPRIREFEAEMVAFEAATLQRHEAVSRLILRKRPGVITMTDKFSELIFHKLSRTDNMMAMRLLLEENAEINAQNLYGETALSDAAKRKAYDVMRWLLDNGAKDAIDIPEKSALCELVRNRDIPFAKEMLEHTLRSRQSDRPEQEQEKAKAAYVMHALRIAAGDGDVQMLEMLFDVTYEIDWPTDIALFDIFDDGEITSPLHSAAQGGHLSATMFLVEKGLPIEGKNESEWTPLHYAATRGHRDVLLYLLFEGADVNLQTLSGHTALHKAVANRVHIDNVAALLSFKASVDVQVNGSTALHIAAEKGNEEIVSLLLDQGCSVDIVNEQGSSAWDIAITNCHLEVINVLETAAARKTRGGFHFLKDLNQAIW